MHRWLIAGILLLCLVAIGGAVDLSWTDTDETTTESFTLSPGLVYLSIFSQGQVSVNLLDTAGQEIDKGYLMLLEGNGEASKAVRIGTAGEYHLSISGYQEWTVSLTDPPEDLEPGLEWTGDGVQSSGLFWLDPGTVRLSLRLQGTGYATLFDEQGTELGQSGVTSEAAEGEGVKEIAIPARARYLINVEALSTAGTWTVSVVPIAGPPPLPSPTVEPAREPAPVAIPTLETPAATPVPTAPIVVPASRFGSRRYLVGNAPSSPPVGISIRAPVAAPAPRSREFGTGSTSFSPPKGNFARWYPATRWRAGR